MTTKMAFTHYFPPYPLSLDNKPTPDYYDTNYLLPTGEGGHHKAYGALLRDRPEPVAPVATGYELRNAKIEVAQAKAGGFDGFVVDILGTATSGGSNNYRFSKAIFDAATADGSFHCMPMIDCSGLASQSVAVIAGLIKFWTTFGCKYTDANGKIIFTAFLAEKFTPAFWQQVLTTLGSNYGFVACFNNPNLITGGTYDNVVIGYALWGSRSPAQNSVSGNIARITSVHAKGKIWMHPVSIQDERPNQHIYDEACNTENLRLTWQAAIDGNADWVQCVTWNDYSEGAQFAPSKFHGSAFLNLNAYYIARWKTGAFPAITKDKLVLSHRKHFRLDKPTYPETSLMVPRGGTSTPRDTLEVVAMLTAPGTLTITSGTAVTTKDAPAGISFHLVPLQAGTQQAELARA